MKANTVKHLACPACRGGLRLQTAAGADGTVASGALHCDRCATATPIVRGFPLFDETRYADGDLSAALLEELERKLFGDESSYEEFIALKSQRNARDAYAAFQPFNESSRSILALLEPIRAHLKPGDVIVDTWCRTGWSSEWLAGLFPEQQVIGLWEGNSNVLGYKGFAWWLGDDAGRRVRRASNVDIVFAHADRPLPIASGRVRMVFGLDSIHRYAQQHFLAECRRIGTDDALLLFPHVHLTNSEPDPFFERGGHQYHGRQWKKTLERAFSGDAGARAPFVLSEPVLFDAGKRYTLRDDADTADYNGVLLVVPQAWDGRDFATGHAPQIAADSQLIVNPLLRIDFSTGAVSWHHEDLAGMVGHMMLRHPIYERRLERVIDRALTPLECQFVFEASRQPDIAAIARRLGVAWDEAVRTCERLQAMEVVHVVRVSPAALDLQRFHGDLSLPVPAATLAQAWPRLERAFGERPLLRAPDGSAFDFAAADQLVAATAGWIESASRPGERVMVVAPMTAEYFFVAWACWRTGRVLVPVDPALPLAQIRNIAERVAPALLIGQAAPVLAADATLRQCVFDSLATDDTPEDALFSSAIGDWLEQGHTIAADAAAIDVDADATILFTSGSTGMPKGVRLSHRSLMHSARLMASHFGWKAGDVLLSLGGLHTMSGLRNPALAALLAGVTVEIPDTGLIAPPRLMEIIESNDVTILSAVPSALAQWMAWQDRRGGPGGASRISLPSLRQILCTGQFLNAGVRAQCEQRIGVPVYSYYGLTETGGVCLADRVAQPGAAVPAPAEGDLGDPAGAIAQVVDEDGRPVASGLGELRIYSHGLMTGYLEPDSASSVRKIAGWVHTGDLAERLPDGSFRLIGRRDGRHKNRWGEVVYPAEIEQVCRDLPAVAEAVCLTTGQGEGAGLRLAAVMADGSEGDAAVHKILAAVDARLGSRKRPDSIRVFDELPKLSNGKIDRVLLTTLLQEQAATDEPAR